MKPQSLSNVLIAGAIVLGSAIPVALTAAPPSYAGNTSFYCGWSGGYPATVADTPRGSVVIIRWSSEYFRDAGYDSQTRCNIVSSKFQSSYNTGALNFITAGVVNGLPVICATGDYGGACSSNTVLYTLKPGQNAAVVIQRLYEIRAGAGGVLYESAKVGGNNANVTSVNIKEFLDNAPVESVTSKPSVTKPATNPATTQPVTQPTKPNSGQVW